MTAVVGVDVLVTPQLPCGPQRRKRLPRAWWEGGTGRARARTATHRMIRELGWDGLAPEELAQRITYDTFCTHGLRRMLATVYGSSPYAALHDLFPALLPWQMKHTPNGYWRSEQGREHAQVATRWLVAQLGLTNAAPEEVAACITQTTFDHRGLRGMLEFVYGDSPYAALVDLYPTLLPWQMAGGAPVEYWRGKDGRNHARAATRWLLTQVGLDRAVPAQVAAQVTSTTFATHGLIGMLSKVYKDSPYAALADIYPDLTTAQMKRAPRARQRHAPSPGAPQAEPHRGQLPPADGDGSRGTEETGAKVADAALRPGSPPATTAVPITQAATGQTRRVRFRNQGLKMVGSR